MYSPVGVTAGTSSYFAPVEKTLDPDLFDGTRMKTKVRLDLTSAYGSFLDQIATGRDQWLRGWVAGSAVTFQWRNNDDLDVLLGVNFVGFRSTNPAYLQMGDAEIAKHLNDQMRMELWPSLDGYMGRFEVTTYVNARGWDIGSMKPRAAYDLHQDGWTVPPTADAPQVDPQWELSAAMYHQRAIRAVEGYSQSLTDLQHTINPVGRVDAERRFKMSVEQAINLFDTVHEGRRSAFSPVGGGYESFEEYLWKAGKQAGWIPALREIKDYHDRATQASNLDMYGVDLPDTDTLIRRAAMRYR